MAAIFMDFFEATLTAPISDEDTAIGIGVADVQRVFDALGLGDTSVYDYIEGMLAYVPMWLDDGTHQEQVRVVRGSVALAVVTVQRGAVAYAFAAGTKLRCAPSAFHATSGFDTVHYVATGYGPVAVETRNFVVAVPGETALWMPPANASSLDVRLPIAYPGAALGQLVAGDELPARIDIACLQVERTVRFTFIDSVYETPVAIVGAEATSTTLLIPASARLAVLEIRRTPVALITAVSDAGSVVGVTRWQVKPEFYA